MWARRIGILLLFLAFITNTISCSPKQPFDISKKPITITKIIDTNTPNFVISNTKVPPEEILYDDVVKIQTCVNVDGCYNSSMDLDNPKGEIADNVSVDISFMYSGGTSYFLTLDPKNGSMGYINQNTNMSIDVCKSNLDSYKKGSFPEFPSGRPICILTNEGRIAIIQYRRDSFKLEMIEGVNTATLEVQITVWK
jgi:hypothetical protein